LGVSLVKRRFRRQYLYGKNRDEGSLTPYIHHLIHSNLDEIILDGEMLAWDPITRRTRPFGTLKTAALDLSQNPFAARPVFKIFDVLYAKGKNQAAGQNLLGKKLMARKEFIRRFVKQSEGRLEMADQKDGKTPEDIRLYVEEVLERLSVLASDSRRLADTTSSGEGLVIKNPKSTYVLNGREDSWIKVKPDYMSHVSRMTDLGMRWLTSSQLGENYDLLIIGGFWGSGKRGGYFGSFFCGILDDSNENNPRRVFFMRLECSLMLSKIP
jgi:DNA ligase-4